MQGQLLVHVGRTEGVESSTLLALLSGGFVTSAEIARQYGNGESINLHFHEGSRYEVYSANVGDGLFIAIIYDRHVQTSRIGMVWLYTRRTIEELLSIISSLKDAVPAQTLDDDFGSSLMAEIDSAFGGLPTVTQGENAFAPSAPDGNARNIRPMSNDTKPPSPDGAPRSVTNAQARSRPDAMDSSDPGLLDIEAAIKLGIIPPDLIESLSNKET